MEHHNDNKILSHFNFKFRGKNTKELLDLINLKLRSFTRKIDYCLKVGEEIFHCEYNFTKMKLGTKINREFLNSIKKSQTRYSFSSIENRFSHLSLN